LRLLGFVQWLNETPWSVFLRENDYSFFVIETIHILGLGFSIGLIMWVDLRLMGLSLRRERVTDVIRQFEPWARGGVLIMLASGSLLLLSEPLKCYTAVAFRLKAVMLILAGLNVWFFNAKVFPTVAEWDDRAAAPWRARMVGALSMTLWIGIIIAGRWTAYK
jgi:hypothetical protein